MTFIVSAAHHTGCYLWSTVSSRLFYGSSRVYPLYVCHENATHCHADDTGTTDKGAKQSRKRTPIVGIPHLPRVRQIEKKSAGNVS